MKEVSAEDSVVIYVKWVTRQGRRVYASEYGLKAFRLEIPRSKYRPSGDN